MSTSDRPSIPPFLDEAADALHALPGVLAVALGGSRAQGTSRPDSDWDVAVYYRGSFDPQAIRDLGWPGRLSAVGEWSPTFNGGGKVTVGGEQVDIHYRDLDLIDRVHGDAVRGVFTVENLLFHQAGLPSYLLLAELGLNRTLRGSLPRWGYPAELRRTAPGVWWHWAELTLRYAEDGHARHGRVAQCLGLVTQAACFTAHAILAHRGAWITNEKQLLTRAGLRWVDEAVSECAGGDTGAVSRVEGRLRAAFAGLDPL
ncbi:nucleotidyltransferase domain-containing protein [Pseudolysinimonas sp.]|uniref:nucleotidyltransferase domain-containing protein n=1 Tax=Pseudolysinimonas sp. TaxID=2680009 RepID=UPI003F80FF0A